MKTPNNPFITSGYIAKEYFCNREKETRKLIESTLHGNNITLISPRRMGKTGLIIHTFEELKNHKVCESLYIDIYATRSISEFIKTLSEAIIEKFPQKTSVGKKFWEFIKHLRPLISYDPISGSPQIQINYQTEAEKEQTLHHILQFLDTQNKRIIVAIDEFQQITEYPEENMEALLRSEIQHLKNTSFIFCGSKRHMMLNIFANNKKPFYASTQFMFLTEIENETYASFIKELFAKKSRKIEDDAIQFILNWTKSHTYYTQSLCNKIYAQNIRQIDRKFVKKMCAEILEQNTPIYLQLRELLTTKQWNYMIAVAKEESVEQITAQHFLMKYNIGTASNSTRLMRTLTEKELILETQNMNKTEYRMYDVFFSHWLKNKY